MTKIIHITDTHLMPAGRALFDTDPAVRFRQCLRDIERTQPNATWLIITGDLTHRGEPEAYALLKEILAEETRIPWRLTIGNHDERSAFQSAFPDQPVDGNGFVQSVIDVEEARLIVLDTQESGTQGGRLCERRLAWLADRLDEAKDREVQIFMHHPPFLIGMAGVDSIRLADEKAFAELLEKHGRVRHLYFGHVHRPIAGNWRGISMSMSFGLNHQAALNLDGATYKGRIGPAEYAVALLEHDRTVVHFHDFLYVYPEIITPGMDGQRSTTANKLLEA